MLDKEEGVTSRRVDNLVARRFLSKKVGHLGTLDPFATGLLVVAVGKGTKFLPYLDSSYKTYLAKLILGEKKDTGDLTGRTIERRGIPSFGEKEIDKSLSSFLGFSKQLPPMTSAIKIDGVPLYKLAHKGESKERKERPIEVKELLCLGRGENWIEFQATVSSGTYIRVLGEDIAVKLGTVGYLESLRRTKIGPLDVKEAKKLGELTEEDFLSPSPFVNLERVEIDGKEALEARNGKKICLTRAKGDEVALVHEGEVLAVYARESGPMFVSKRGLF